MKTLSCQNAFMRTTIDLPDNVFRDAKIRAAQTGIKLKELIRDYIEKGLADAGESTPPRRRSPLPIAFPATGRPMPIVTNADINRLLDKEEAEDVAGKH